MQTSVQLYSLRESFSIYGIDHCLKLVADSGFDAVELVSIPEDIISFKKKVESYGLKVSSAHIGLNDMARLNDIKQLTNEFEFNKVIIPWIEPNYFKNNFLEFIEKSNEIYKNINSLNLQLCYHNHDFEFSNGDNLTPILSLVPGIKLELDVFWLKVSKQNPIKFLNDNAKNIALIHLKEHSEALGFTSPIVGSGDIEAEKIIKFAKAQNHDYIIVEFEKSEINELDYLKKSNEFIKKYL